MQVFVHIGHYKCGTTALQRRLSSQRSALAEQGILYPKLDRRRDGKRPLPSHSTLALEMLRSRHMRIPPWYRQRRAGMPRPPEADTVRRRMAEILEDAGRANADIILSSEAFMRFADGPESEGLVEDLLAILEGADVTAFAHLRRPDAHMPSFYNQLIKDGGGPPNLSLNLATSLRPIHMDYARALRPWVAALGTERVIVRRYEHRVGDITDDMFAGLGLDIELPADSALWENERFPDTYIESLRRWNKLRAPRELTDKVIATATTLAGTTYADVRVEFLAATARVELRTRFEAIDAELTKLLGLDSSMFPDLDEISNPDPEALGDIDAHKQFGTELFEKALGDSVGGIDTGGHADPSNEPQRYWYSGLGQRIKHWLK